MDTVTLVTQLQENASTANTTLLETIAKNAMLVTRVMQLRQRLQTV